MLLGLIDFPDESGHTRPLRFNQPESLAALDLVIWRPDAIADRYGPARRAGAAAAPLELLQAQDLVMHTRAWREEFRAFLARGGSLVVIAPSFESLPLHTPQDIISHDPLEALPERFGIQRTPVTPGAVQCHYGEPFRSLFTAISDLLLARSALTQDDSQAIASTGGHVCGLYRFVHPGRVLVLPSLAAMPDRAGAERLIQALSATVAGLRRSAAQVVSASTRLLPAPAEEIRLARELESVSEQRRRLEQTESELRARLVWLGELASLLVTDAGGSLAVATAALQSLGGRVLHEFDQASSAIVEIAEAKDLTLLLMLANPGEDMRECRQRLAPLVNARCEETQRPLQAMVLRPGEHGDGFGGLANSPCDTEATRWHFVSGRALYGACARSDAKGLLALTI